MKSMLIVATVLGLSGAAQAMDKCQIKMENAAAFELAQSLSQSVLRAKLVWFEMGAWTEAVANNTGSGRVAVKLGRDVVRYSVAGKQIANTDNCNVTAIGEVDASELPKELIQAEKYKLAIGDAEVMSETDSPWEVFYSRSSVSAEFTADEVAQALGAGDQPVESWTKAEVIEFLDGYINENPYEDAAAAASYKKLKKALTDDFVDLRGFKVGVPDGGTLEIFFVGRTRSGKLVGVRTTVAET
jgi:hypothetical protein